MSVFVFLLIRVLLALLARVGRSRLSNEQIHLDAERFFHLALWGALHGNQQTRKRMLLRAKAFGFADEGRLADPALAKAQ